VHSFVDTSTWANIQYNNRYLFAFNLVNTTIPANPQPMAFASCQFFDFPMASVISYFLKCSTELASNVCGQLPKQQFSFCPG
jgi:hypothetical protein